MVYYGPLLKLPFMHCTFRLGLKVSKSMVIETPLTELSQFLLDMCLSLCAMHGDFYTLKMSLASEGSQ